MLGLVLGLFWACLGSVLSLSWAILGLPGASLPQDVEMAKYAILGFALAPEIAPEIAPKLPQTVINNLKLSHSMFNKILALGSGVQNC